VVGEADALEDDGVTVRVKSWLPGVAAAALLAAVIAVLVVIGVTGSSRPSGSGSVPPGQALAATWSLTPTSHLFGDTVHLRVDATVDRRRLDPRYLQLDAPLKPYERVGPRLRTQRNIGRYTEIVYGIDLRCVKQNCVSGTGGPRNIKLDPAHLVYRSPEGHSSRLIEHAWPRLISYSRLDPADIAARARGVTPFGQNPNRAAQQPLPPWLFTSDLSPVSYSVRPNRAFWYAVVFALILVSAAGVLLRPYLPRPAFLRRRSEPGPLEIALATVESARASGRQERERQALELLGTELVRSGELHLAESARALAWSQPDPPEPALTAALALDVRKVIEERSNGHSNGHGA
jgi:hypothetical protein